MLKIFTLFFTLFLSQALFSQTTAVPIPTDADTTIYTAVDTVASFPGGRPAWVKFLEKNLNPAVGVENSAKVGIYNVKIKFTVTKDGTLKDFVAVTKYKHGFEEEVIRVLKLSPKWIPAKKNGVNVNSTVEELQVFEISKG
jgi:protein TonB